MLLSRSIGMPSRREGPPSIWDTHGISGNVFAGPVVSSTAPYSQELNPWSSHISEPIHSSTAAHIAHERPQQKLQCGSGNRLRAPVAASSSCASPPSWWAGLRRDAETPCSKEKDTPAPMEKAEISEECPIVTLSKSHPRSTKSTRGGSDLAPAEVPIFLPHISTVRHFSPLSHHHSQYAQLFCGAGSNLGSFMITVGPLVRQLR